MIRKFLRPFGLYWNQPLTKSPCSGTNENLQHMKHLYELWYRVLYCSLGILCCTGIFSVYQESYFSLLLASLHGVDQNSSFVFPKLQDGFILTIFLPFLLGFISCYPVFLYTLWAFIVPGFHMSERKVYTNLCVWALIFQSSLCVWWCNFGYKFVWKLFTQYMLHPGYTFQPHVLPFVALQAQCFFFLFFLGAFPIFFYQLLFFLKVTSEQIAYWRFPFFSGCCLLSAWITPGDILLQLFGTLFGVLCFEMTLYFLIFVQTREEVFLSIKKH